jgi:hypothetical protein
MVMINKRIASEIAVGVILVVAIIVGGIFLLRNESISKIQDVKDNEIVIQKIIQKDVVMCTQEAKLCEDGKTYVSRTGPNCEFSLCPKNNIDAVSWKTYKNKENGFEFIYPNSATIAESLDVIKVSGVVQDNTEYGGWEMKVFKNNKKYLDIDSWFEATFDRDKNSDCGYLASNIIIKDSTSKLISSKSLTEKCDDGGYYTMSPDKSVVISWKFGQDPGKSIDLVTSTFKFVK